MKNTLVAGCSLLALAAGAHAGAAQMPTVQQQVQVDSHDGKVLVTLLAHNGSAKPVYLPNALYKSARLLGRAFDIKDAATGAEVDYIGPMVKRGPYTAADYLPLAPGASHRHTIDITASYAFKPGTHRYQLAYGASYVADLPRLTPAATALAPVTFSHTAK